MNNLKELLRTSTPYRPRQRSDMPLLEWVEIYQRDGYVKIPAYISSKKGENPEGHKVSKLRTNLFNGYSNMDQTSRLLVQETFVDAYYCLIVDADNLKQFILLNKSLVKVFKDDGNHVKPLLPSIPNPKAKTASEESSTAETDKVGAVQAEAQAQPKKTGRFQKKNK